MKLLVVMVGLGAMFVVPILGLVWFVQWRAGKRRDALRGPWTALAQRIGGQLREGAGFTGTSITAPRPYGTLQVKMVLVSAFDAASVPYYENGGGTYTEVSAVLANGHPSSFIPPGSKVYTFTDHARVPSLAYLGANASIFLEPHCARIVFPGVSERADLLEAASQSLDSLAQLILTHGPVPIRAAA